MNKFCIRCGKLATFDSPNDLCDEHWIDWWCDGMKEQGFTDEQIAEYRRDAERAVQEYCVLD